MSITFGDFNNAILELIQNKDPLGLNSDIDSYKTALSEAPLEMPSDTEMKMEEYHYDAIPHYLKSAANVNNTTHTDTKTSPTLQVNAPNINKRPIHSVSSDNLARSTTSFKSFKIIQQSCKRSHTNSCTDDVVEILGSSLEIIENNLTVYSKSNELIDEFNTKTKVITKTMQGLHLSTIDVRNKLSRGDITNICPIITQETMSP